VTYLQQQGAWVDDAQMAQTKGIARLDYSYFQNLQISPVTSYTMCSLTQTPALGIDKHLHHLLIDLPSFFTLFLLYQSLGDFFRFDLTLACLIKSLV
jgi:hypothetical protein